MTRYRLTVLMGILLAGLGAYVFFVELPGERSRTLTETRTNRLLPFEEHEITGLAVRTESGEVVLAPGERRNWKISAPLSTDADTREVEALLRALALGRISRVVEEQAAALAPFGLEKPSVVLTLSAGPRRETLSLGDSGPISNTLYALRGSDRKVLLTTLSAKDVLNKTLLTFRRKEVLRFDQTQVDRLRLAYPGTEILLQQVALSGQPKPTGKKKWMVRYPMETPADQLEVRRLLMKLEDLKALGFVDPGPRRAVLFQRLTKPDLKITMRTSGIDQTVKLFQLDPASGEAYAVTTAEAPIARISPMAIKDLAKGLFTLQDKRLLGVDRDEVVRLTVKTREEQYVLLNRNGGWILEDQPDQKLTQETVDLFVSRVVDLPAELRVIKRTGPLAPYGLSSPSAEFTASDKDGKPLARVVLGKREGGLVYAMGHLPGLYQARADLLTQIPAKRDLAAPSAQ